MRLVFVGHRCCDHSPSSGYDQVCSLFPEAGWLSGPDLAAGQLVWVREPVGGSPAFTAASSRQTFHVFYGDYSGTALPAILRCQFPQATIVSTVHQPTGMLEHDAAARASLDVVDAVITVSEAQARQLARLGLSASIHVVPHGIWTHAFRPTSPSPHCSRNSVLLVGNHLRDWNGMQQILEHLAAAGVHSVALGSAAAERLSRRDPYVHLVSRVSESDLALMYDQAAALLLPVLDATASNALLEAMAAGCPPWSTNTSVTSRTPTPKGNTTWPHHRR
jgi:glycosyltransferase involved in cell wall biosynthesis